MSALPGIKRSMIVSNDKSSLRNCFKEPLFTNEKVVSYHYQEDLCEWSGLVGRLDDAVLVIIESSRGIELAEPIADAWNGCQMLVIAPQSMQKMESFPMEVSYPGMRGAVIPRHMYISFRGFDRAYDPKAIYPKPGIYAKPSRYPDLTICASAELSHWCTSLKNAHHKVYTCHKGETTTTHYLLSGDMARGWHKGIIYMIMGRSRRVPYDLARAVHAFFEYDWVRDCLVELPRHNLHVVKDPQYPVPGGVNMERILSGRTIWEGEVDDSKMIYVSSEDDTSDDETSS